VLGLCEQFSCLPSQLYAEEAEILRLVSIKAMATPDEHPEEVSDVNAW
jgi:hypothetical protein